MLLSSLCGSACEWPILPRRGSVAKTPQAIWKNQSPPECAIIGAAERWRKFKHLLRLVFDVEGHLSNNLQCWKFYIKCELKIKNRFLIFTKWPITKLIRVLKFINFRFVSFYQNPKFSEAISSILFWHCQELKNTRAFNFYKNFKLRIDWWDLHNNLLLISENFRKIWGI